VFASPDVDDWKEGVHSEMDSILSNGTWELVVNHIVVNLWVVSGCSK
jgi:hypothetical protein